MSAVRSNTKRKTNSKIDVPFLANCPVGEPTAYHFSSRLEAMEKATKILSHSLVLGTCFVSNFYDYKLKTPFVHWSIKITFSFCLAKKQSIRVKVKMESARVNHWGCCHQKDLQFIAMCFQHDPGKTSNLNAQRGTPSCQTIVKPPKLQPSKPFEKLSISRYRFEANALCTNEALFTCTFGGFVDIANSHHIFFLSFQVIALGIGCKTLQVRFPSLKKSLS